jgi:FkbM family methyltransferase
VIVPVWVRRARLRALMARHLVNWREAFQAYIDSAPAPTLRFRNGATLVHGPRDAAGFLFFEVFANGCYRVGLPKALDGVVVDIGANIGAFTLDCARRYPEVEIHAYEPDSETCRVLRQNIAENGLDGRVTVRNEAVTAHAGPLTLWRGDGSTVTSAFLAPGQQGEACTATGVTFETVADRAAHRIALLKMDAEGAEADILEAARTSLDGVERIVAEYHEWLVPDVRARISRVLSPAFDVEFTSAGRCGPMLRARRRALLRDNRSS